MKNFLFGVLVTLCFMVAFAATPAGQQVLTVKPAQPVACVSYLGGQPQEFVKKWAAQGYVITGTSSTSYNGALFFVTMVKY